MGLQAKPIDAALAFDTIQKFAEEGCVVSVRFDKAERRFHVKLEGRLWDPELDEYAVAIDVRLDQALETALQMFREAWIEARPGGQIGDPTVPLSSDEAELIRKAGGLPDGEMRFRCVGPCWTGDCECRELEGQWNPERRPPLHDGCVCVLEPARRPST